MDELTILKDYLVGRTDVFVLQQEHGGYQPYGKWERVDGKPVLVEAYPLTDVELQQHLDGTVTAGTYTLREDGTVRAVTWDFDEQEEDTDKAKKQAMWKALSFIAYLQGPWMMFESGKKGVHVVQSFNPPLAGPVAYAYARDRARAAGLWDAERDEPTIECNPKQPVTTPALPYGNLTKLPLGIHRLTGNRAKMLEGSRVAYAMPPILHDWDPEERAATQGMGRVRSDELKATYTTRPEGGWIAQAFDGQSKIKRGRNNTLRAWRAVCEGLDMPPELVRHNVEAMNEAFEEPLPEEELGRTVLRGI